MKTEKFLDTYQNLDDEFLKKSVDKINRITPDDVLRELTKVPLSFDGFLSILSPASDVVIDQVEARARELTEQRFGRIVNLYIPIYLSNECINGCEYCGFSKDQPIERKTLSLEEIKSEGERILAEGYRNILLVAGEDKRKIPFSLIEDCVKLLKGIGFVFVGLEAQAMKEDQYKQLGQAGLDAVTIYQETYDRTAYEKLHTFGPKRNFDWRLEAPERVARAGIRSVSIGFLLGLSNFYQEAIVLGAHAKFLQRKFWQTSVGISFPRIHEAPENFKLPYKVSDKELVRLIMAVRLANPDSLLTLSTRESPALRDRLFGAGINQISAGSKTNPGGYSEGESGSGEQFPVVDDRSPQEVVKALKAKGLEWVWKDWDENLKPVS